MRMPIASIKSSASKIRRGSRTAVPATFLSSESATVSPRTLLKATALLEVIADNRLRRGQTGAPCESPGPAPVPGRQGGVPDEEIGIPLSEPLVDQYRDLSHSPALGLARATVTLALASQGPG